MLAFAGMPAQTTAVELGERECAILDLERTWWQLGDEPKEALIKRHLGLSPSRYYQLLHALLDLPAAMEYDPLVVRRGLRARQARRRVRVEGRRVGVPPRR